MNDNEIIINLKGLTADSRKAIQQALSESQKMVNDNINQLALITINNFDELSSNNTSSGFETMKD